MVAGLLHLDHLLSKLSKAQVAESSVSGTVLMNPFTEEKTTQNRSVKQKKEELSEFRFEPSAEEKITRIPFCGTKIGGTLGIPSEPFRGRLSLA